MAATCAGAWTIYSTPALTIPGSSLATTFTFSPHMGRRTYVTAFSFVHRWAQRPCWVLVISCPSSSSPPSVALSGVSLVQISSVQISVVPRKSNRGATSICRRCSPQLEPKGKSGRGLGLTGEGGGGRWISSMEDSPTPDEASDRGCSAGGWRQISQITLGGSCCRAML